MILAESVEDRAEIVKAFLLAALGIAAVIGGLLLLIFIIQVIGQGLGAAGRVLPDWFKDKFLTLCGVAGFVGLIFAYIYDSVTILVFSLVGIGLFIVAVLIGMNE